MIALYSLGALLSVFAGWCVYDFLVSIRQVPGQHTASMYIKRWVREAPWHRALLSLAIIDAAAYLTLHLILQVI